MGNLTIYCQICAKEMLVDPTEGLQAFCSSSCQDTLENLLRQNISNIRELRIAELDYDKSLDFLVSSVDGPVVTRYLIPEDSAVHFRAHPPPVGLDFPILTIDYLDEESKRIEGREAVTSYLKSLSTPYAVTRKFKAKKR